MILTVIDVPETNKSPVSTIVVATGETATIQDVRGKNKENTKNAKCFKVPKTMLEESLIHEIEYGKKHISVYICIDQEHFFRAYAASWISLHAYFIRTHKLKLLFYFFR